MNTKKFYQIAFLFFAFLLFFNGFPGYSFYNLLKSATNFGTEADKNVTISKSGQTTTVKGDLDVSEDFILNEQSAPSTPASGKGYLYEKTDGIVYFKNDAGTEYDLTSGTSSTSWYGVSWDYGYDADTYTRLGSLKDSADTATIPDGMLSVHNKLRRCVLLNDGTVDYYLDSGNSTLKASGAVANIDTTGGLADGQVVVEVPKFYYYHHDDQVDSIHTWKISTDSISGFTAMDTFYVGAYPASLYDVSINKYIGDDADTYAAADTLCSVSGVKPHTNETRAEFRAAAEKRGAGWHLLDHKGLSAIQMLYLIEYADFDIQDQISNGNTQFAGWDYDADIGPTGKSNSDGNFSGGTSTGGGDSLDYVSYRGIEDIFGNLWQFVDGINVNNVLTDTVATIADASGDGSKIGVRTNTAHGLSTGKIVGINAVVGLTDLNGGWEITVVDADSFTVDDTSVQSYTSGGNVAIGESRLYLCTDYSNYDDDTDTDYTLSGNLAESDDYITNVLNLGLGFWTENVGGSSSTYLCDYYYTSYDTAPSGGWRVVRVGGVAFDGAGAGVFCVASFDGSSVDVSTLGARLCFFGN